MFSQLIVNWSNDVFNYGTEHSQDRWTKVIGLSNNYQQLAGTSTTLFVSCVTRNVKTRTWWIVFLPFSSIPCVKIPWSMQCYSDWFSLMSALFTEVLPPLNILVIKGSWSSQDTEWYGNYLVKIMRMISNTKTGEGRFLYENTIICLSMSMNYRNRTPSIISPAGNVTCAIDPRPGKIAEWLWRKT